MFIELVAQQDRDREEPRDERRHHPGEERPKIDYEPGLTARKLEPLVENRCSGDRSRQQEGEARRRLPIQSDEQPGGDGDPGPADSRYQGERLGDANPHRLRECQVDREQTTRSCAIGDPQDAGSDDQHEDDETNLPEALFDQVIEQDADDEGRHRREDDEPGEPAVGVAVERAVADRRHAGRDQPQPVRAEVGEKSDQRPDVEHHAERQRRDERIVPARQGRNDDEMAGRRHRQELRESLDDPHHDRLG
jgi:hypothetical protein